MAGKQIEQNRARGPIVRMINQTRGLRSITNYNLQWKMGNAQGMNEESGKPDSFCFVTGSRVACIEYKAFEGTLVFSDLRDNQREWRDRYALPTDTQYWIGFHITWDRDVTRLNNKLANAYLVPYEEWLALEGEAANREAKSIAATQDSERMAAFKDFTLEQKWGKFMLRFHGGSWCWPEELHPFLQWASLPQFQSDASDNQSHTAAERSDNG